MEQPDVNEMIIEKNIPGLIEVLKHQDWFTREKSVRELARIGDARAVEPLFMVAQKDPYQGKLEKDMGSYGIYSYPLRKVAQQAFTSVVERIGELALEPLIKLHGDGWAIDMTRKPLAAIGSLAVEQLLVSLMDPRNQFKRRAAAEVLGDIGDERAVDRLMVALMDLDYHVRAAAAEALGRIGETKAVDALLAAFKNTWDKEILWEDACSEIAMALGKLRDPRAVKVLRTALKNDTVWMVAEKALLNIGGTEVIDTFISVLQNDKRTWVRESAARRLGWLRDRRALKPLAEVSKCKEESNNVRQAARTAIREIRFKSFSPFKKRED